MTGICFVLLHFRYRLPFFEEMLDFGRVGAMLLGISVFISLVSAVDYTFSFRAALAAGKSAE